MRTILNFALFALVAIPGLLQTGGGTIQGIVRRPDTKEPIAGVSVALAAGDGAATVVTDETGRFRFSNRASGPFSVRATRQDFFPAKAQPGDRTNAGTYFGTLGPPANEAELVMELVPAGRITGRILTARGEPLAGATLAILIDAYEDGRHVLERFQSTLQSNDRGEFRVFGLVPGRYYLLAQTSVPMIQVVNGQNRRFAIPRITYYPGTLQPAEAQPIVVQPNADAPVSFSVVEPLPTTVTGRAAGAALPDSARLSFSLVQKDSDVFDATDSGIALAPPIVNERGEFEIGLSRPGSFELFALLVDATQPQLRYVGRTSIRVPGVTQGIEVRLAPAFDLQVRIVGNGDATVEGQIPAGFRIRPYERLPLVLQPDVAAASRPAQAGRGMTAEQRIEVLRRNRAASLDWKTFVGLSAGRYFVDFTLLSGEDAYVADILQGGRSIYEDGAIIVGSEQPAPVEVVMKRPGGEIRGVVNDADGKTVSSAYVSVIPDGRHRESPVFFKSATTDARGQFSVLGLAPGSYKVMAWDSIPAGAERNAQFTRPFEQFARSITVVAGSKEIDLKVPLIRR